MSAELLLPDAPEFAEAARPPIARFAAVRPELVVRCRSREDVVEALALVRRERREFAIRSGGHCFEGRSSTTGVLIDVSPIDHVRLAGGVAAIGAGARLAEVYDALHAHGVTIAGGCGPTVGIAGLALGGGLGILGRTHGLTSDQLVGAEVVLADGGVVQADAECEPDLFWALRGAGAARFGVVTELRLRVVPALPVTTIHATWPVERAADAIAAWQQSAPDAPDELAVSVIGLVPAHPRRAPSVHVFGALVGTEEQARAALRELAADARLEHMPYRAAKHHLAEHGPADIAEDEGHAFSKSEFFRRPLPNAAIDALVAHLIADRRAGEARSLDFMPWGGAYNRVPATATAFPHRAERFLLKHEVVVVPGLDAARDWLERSWSLVHPYGSGGAYANFPDPGVGDEAYFGENLARLREVKRAYDPTGLFPLWSA
jgi:FAD/FMN-containing dehydrogenase